MRDDRVITVEQAVDAVSELLGDRVADWGAIGPQTEFEEIGLDSAEFAELLMVLEEVAGGPVDPRTAQRAVVVADLTRVGTL